MGVFTTAKTHVPSWCSHSISWALFFLRISLHKNTIFCILPWHEIRAIIGKPLFLNKAQSYVSLFSVWIHVSQVISMDWEIQITVSLNSKANTQFQIIWAFNFFLEAQRNVNFYSAYLFLSYVVFVRISTIHEWIIYGWISKYHSVIKTI